MRSHCSQRQASKVDSEHEPSKVTSKRGETHLRVVVDLVGCHQVITSCEAAMHATFDTDAGTSDIEDLAVPHDVPCVHASSGSI